MTYEILKQPRYRVEQNRNCVYTFSYKKGKNPICQT